MEAFLLNYGLPGVVILGLGYWILRQANEIAELHKIIRALYDKRIEDRDPLVTIARDNISGNAALAHSLQQLTRIIEAQAKQ